MSTAQTAAPPWLPRLAIAAAVVVVLGYGVSYALRPVALVVATARGPAVRFVPGTVEVKAEFETGLKSDVNGRVISSELDVGKPVHKNDVLVQIDPGDVDLDIERMKNEIVAARKKVELGSTFRQEVLNSRDTLDTLERQMKQGAYPQAEFAKQQRLHQQLQQKMELDEVNLKLLLVNWENSLHAKEREKGKMSILAPSDGVVTAVFARTGDLIERNSPIANIIALSRTVEAKITEENFAAIKLGQKATVRFLSYGADQYNAVISKILPAADPTTQRYTVFLDIFLPEGRVLLPGLTGEVQVIIAKRDNALLIPRRALIGDYVYVITGGKVERRKVAKGYDSMNFVEIISGLQDGEPVVVEQLDRFHEGERVRTKVLPN